MYKILLSTLCVFILLVAGCSKERIETPDKNGELYSATFNLNTFIHEITPISGIRNSALQSIASGSSELKNIIDVLKYIIIDSDGIKIADNTIQASNGSFGTINEYLPLGEYTIYVMGSKNGFASISYSPPPSFTSIHVGSITADVFAKKTNFEIKGDPISQEILMERIVGKVELNILDEIPETINKITLSVQNVAYGYLFDNVYAINDGVLTGTFHKTDVPPLSGQGEWDKSQFHVYFTLNGVLDVKGKVTIVAFNTNGEVVTRKIIENVPLGIRKKTTLSGNLFDGNSTSDDKLTIGVKDEWRTDSQIINF